MTEDDMVGFGAAVKGEAAITSVIRIAAKSMADVAGEQLAETLSV